MYSRDAVLFIFPLRLERTERDTFAQQKQVWKLAVSLCRTCRCAGNGDDNSPVSTGLCPADVALGKHCTTSNEDYSCTCSADSYNG